MWPPKRWEIESGHICISFWVQGERRRRRRRRKLLFILMWIILCFCPFRNFYLTQFDESENLDRTGILEMDLARLSPLDPDRDSLASAASKRKQREGEKEKRGSGGGIERESQRVGKYGKFGTWIPVISLRFFSEKLVLVPVPNESKRE
jgi:hypothetical protein